MTYLLITFVLVHLFWGVSSIGGGSDLVSYEAGMKLGLWVPAALACIWIVRRGGIVQLARALGLGAGMRAAVAAGLLVTLPMAAACFVGSVPRFDVDLLAGSAVIGPVAEEVLFRGFLFQLLWRRAGWPVTSAAIVSAIAFGLAHVQGVDEGLVAMLRGPAHLSDTYVFRGGQFLRLIPAEEVWWQQTTALLGLLASRVAPYALGGGLFAWLTYRWNSLWPAIALHGFTNLWWDLSAGEHALPVLALTPMAVAQTASVALAVLLTIRATPNRAAAGLPNAP